MSGRSDASKAAIAAEVWGVVLEVAMGQRDRFLAALSEFGLTPGDLRALMVLDPQHSRPMGSLAAAWDCDASNVTWMVDRLEQRGLVERRTHPTDRRAKTVALTPLGVQTKTDLFTRLHEPPADLLALDRETLRTLRTALAKLPPSLRAGPRPADTVKTAHHDT
jgi:MarR family transcriptional regulator, organic hydroperoxide resistance regulator